MPGADVTYHRPMPSMRLLEAVHRGRAELFAKGVTLGELAKYRVLMGPEHGMRTGDKVLGYDVLVSRYLPDSGVYFMRKPEFEGEYATTVLHNDYPFIEHRIPARSLVEILIEGRVGGVITKTSPSA